MQNAPKYERMSIILKLKKYISSIQIHNVRDLLYDRSFVLSWLLSARFSKTVQNAAGYPKRGILPAAHLRSYADCEPVFKIEFQL